MLGFRPLGVVSTCRDLQPFARADWENFLANRTGRADARNIRYQTQRASKTKVEMGRVVRS